MKEKKEKKKTDGEKKGSYMFLGMTLGTAAGVVVALFHIHNLTFIPVGLLVGLGIGVSIERKN